MSMTGQPISDCAIFAALDRHGERRSRGVPAISVCLGPPVLSSEALRRWAAGRGRSLVFTPVAETDARPIVVAWIDGLVRHLDLRKAAIGRLAQGIARSGESLESSLRRMTWHERDLFFESVLPIEAEPEINRVCRYLIERGEGAAAAVNPVNLAADLDVLLEGLGPPWIRVFRMMGQLIPGERLPFLAVSLTEPSLPKLERLARWLAEMAAAQPRIGLALLVEPDIFADYSTGAPASRAKSLLHDSIVRWFRPELDGFAQSPLGAVDPVDPAAAVEACLPETAASHESGSENAEVAFETTGGDDDDLARSAAERYLFDILESAVETRGLFELNGTLDFTFGPNRLIEVDLVARSLKLAIEVDGYHHFHDPEAFRRDRRKDLELQKHGYLVARILAEDVVERLEDVIKTIESTVAFRRAAIGQ